MPDNRELVEIIKDRHEEASEVKQCFTDFAFKGLLLATVFFGVILRFYPEDDDCIRFILLWLFCGVVILVMMRIVEIGIHKYSTANRHYGYVLHLYRTYGYNSTTKIEEKVRRTGWEEAMFAWRVIQPILSEKIYNSSFRERKEYRKAEYRWWNTESLINESAKDNGKEILSFHPGSYLQKAQRLIHILCAAIFVIFSFSYFKEVSSMYNATSSLAHTLASFFGLEIVLKWLTANFLDLHSTPENIITLKNYKFLLPYFTLWGCSFFLFIRYAWRQRARRRILEKGFLSIQSCAVVWRLVVLSHLKASRGVVSYKGYTHRLIDNTSIIIKKDLTKIHDGIMKNDWSLTEKLNSEDVGASKKKKDVPVTDDE